MKCSNCPAYWEKILPFSSYPEEWGCLCEPEKGTNQGHLLKDGKSYGCSRNKYMIESAVLKFNFTEKSLELERILNSVSSELSYPTYSLLFDAIEDLINVAKFSISKK